MTTFTQKSLLQRLASRKTKKQNGFTLIELMVVVAIVAVLSAVGLPQLTKAQDKAKDSAALATLTNAAKECSLDLITGADAYDFPAGPFAAVTGDGTKVCEEGVTMTLASEAGAGDVNSAQVVFTGAIPGATEIIAN